MSFDGEAAFFCRELERAGVKPRRVLVVGCGDGTEVRHLANTLGVPIVGIDLDVDARLQSPGVQLVRADARALPFRSNAFGALYCYHVLEHVPGPERAVDEAGRVLEDGGAALYGTPNRARLVGYLGGRATTMEKIRWNLNDWGMRLSGRWSNESGAHAGFTGAELAKLLDRRFTALEDVGPSYYAGKYPRLAGFWARLSRAGLAAWLAPSVYRVGRRAR
jgi:SAM-dependent methyltransferase